MNQRVQPVREDANALRQADPVLIFDAVHGNLPSCFQGIRLLMWFPIVLRRRRWIPFYRRRTREYALLCESGARVSRRAPCDADRGAL